MNPSTDIILIENRQVRANSAESDRTRPSSYNSSLESTEESTGLDTPGSPSTIRLNCIFKIQHRLGSPNFVLTLEVSGLMSEEHRRKRVRKGTKSCWECKRRKVKCIWLSESHTMCHSCLERNTSCLTQDYEDSTPSAAGDPALISRLDKVETLLESLVERIAQAPEGGKQPSASQSGPTPESITATETPTFASVIDQNSGQVRDLLPPSRSRGHNMSNKHPMQSRTAADNSSSTKFAAIKQKLVSMLPCQEDVDYMFGISYGWFLIKHHMLVHLPEGTKNGPGSLFDIASTSEGHPMIIAKLLMCIALCIQQLPPDVDIKRLRLGASLNDTMKNIVEYISSTITSDESLIFTMEGIECLVLQAIYQTNAGNLQRAWLTFRKAIDIAQLVGLHRVSLKPENEISDSLGLRQTLWFQLARGERYISTIIGVPSSIGPSSLPFEDNLTEPSVESAQHSRLYHISGLILARNQDKSTHSFSTTQKIDEELNQVSNKVPPQWWNIPLNLKANRTSEACTMFDRLYCQIWYYQLLMLLHLPYMLRATSDRRYSYSQFSCLNGARGLIKRWLVMCSGEAKLFSNLFEFQAFMAAITLILGLFVPHSSTDQSALHERYEDTLLIEKVIQTFEQTEENSTHVSIGKQSISVIRTLQRVLRNEQGLYPKLRLEIPFFGTISVARSGAIHSLEGEPIIGANSRPAARPTEAVSTFSSIQPGLLPADGVTTNSTSSQFLELSDQWMPGNEDQEHPEADLNNTMFRFDDGHFQMPELLNPSGDSFGSEWIFDEDETIIFDSVTNTDLLGNWNF